MVKKILAYLLLIFISLSCSSQAQAVENPVSSANNRFGIHILTSSNEEIREAAELVNTNGDWGYVTLLIETKDKDKSKWQQIFDELRRKHLIPIVRIATSPDGGGFWKRPTEGDEIAWADFLDELIWPTKNRYVIIYNEPNHALEWGNTVDAKDYARTLNKTIDSLKRKNENFFVINAGFDASAPQKLPAYQQEESFIRDMNDEVPGIFNKLDGWSSHSYPNPGFIGSPTDNGRGTVRTWQWELSLLKSLGLNKDLPVFITETGWKQAEGVTYDKSLPPTDQVATYYKSAFEGAWNDGQIIAVTPFLLNYQNAPFDHFSFKKITGETQKYQLQKDVLGEDSSPFYSQYQTLKSMSKVSGKPVQENKAVITSEVLYPTTVAGEAYTAEITFKNVGQSIWNEYQVVKLGAIDDSNELNIYDVVLPENARIEPGDEYKFLFRMQPPIGGKFQTTINLFMGDKQFDSPPIEIVTEAKSPVVLKIKAGLIWKKIFNGEYILNIAGKLENSINKTSQKVDLDDKGDSQSFENRILLPDTTYKFTLEKPFYRPKTITQEVQSGENTLDFGDLQPDIPSAILHPNEFWKILPWSE